MGAVEVLELDREREYLDYVPIAAPAAGAGAAFKLDSRWDWLIVSLVGSLSTSAVVANRLPSIDYCDTDGTPWVRQFAAGPVAAGVAGLRIAASLRAVPVQPIAGVATQLGLTPAWLPGGWQVQLNVVGMDVGDQLGASRLYVVKRERN